MIRRLRRGAEDGGCVERRGGLPGQRIVRRQNPAERKLAHQGNPGDQQAHKTGAMPGTARHGRTGYLARANNDNRYRCLAGGVWRARLIRLIRWPDLDGIRIDVEDARFARNWVGLPVEDPHVRVTQANGDLTSDTHRRNAFHPSAIRAGWRDPCPGRREAPADPLTFRQRRSGDRHRRVAANGDPMRVDDDAMRQVVGAEQPCHRLVRRP